MSSSTGRLDRLRSLATEKGLDTVLITYPLNLAYLTGFTGTAGILALKPDCAVLYVDARYTELAQSEVPPGVQVVEAPRPVMAAVGRDLGTAGGRAGYEANHTTVSEHEELCRHLARLTLVPMAGSVETLRAVKDESELALQRRAIEIADRVFDSFCGWIKPGMVEDHVAARLEYEQRMAGGECNASGFTIVASGPRTSLPHGVAGPRVIGAGEPVMIDIGTAVGGYCSDLTRTVFLGKAPAEFRKVYQVVLDAQRRALDGIHAGLTGKQCDALARDVITAAGYGDRFGHSLGHTIGLEVHEHPLLSPTDSTVILENMVSSVEPGIYIPGWGGVRIEDVVRITATGCELLSACNRQLVEL